MPHCIPPQEHHFLACSIATRMPIIRHGVAEIETRFSGLLAESETGKKVSKEIQRERQKEKDMDAQRMVETTGSVMGGYGYWLSEAKSLREVIGRERHRNLVSFLKFQRTLERTHVTQLKSEIREKMQARFGTTVYQIYKAKIVQEAIADPQLEVLAKGQVIRTTRKGETEYWRERNAAQTSDVKT